MSLGWADAGIIVPWTVWKQFGDTQIIEESWNAMDLFMNHINDTKYNHETLCGENGNYQWADWLSYEPLESCSGLAFSPQGPLPYRPRHDDSGIGPTQTHFLITVLCQGSHSGESAQPVLGVAHITHPLVEELHGVSKERTGFGKHLCFCCPAQALVALRTVGRY